WNDASSCSTRVSRNGYETDPPALFTTMSRRPSSLTVWSTSCATAARSFTSTAHTMARRPRWRIWSATASRPARVRDARARSAGRAAGESGRLLLEEQLDVLGRLRAVEVVAGGQIETDGAQLLGLGATLDAFGEHAQPGLVRGLHERPHQRSVGLAGVEPGDE